jgi:uncharacterized protein YdeI (YjbR/CyaY-like superfamily)
MRKRLNDDAEQLLFIRRSEWRRWLRSKHDKVTGIWMVYLKGRAADQCIRYEDAIEEALCWGWIDSIIRKVDEERYLRKFTPRRPGGIWSALNKKRIERAIASGCMTKAGLARIDAAKASGQWQKAHAPANGLDGLPEFRKALAASRKAGRFFEGLAPSYKRQFLGWIGQARRDETRARRIAEAVRLLEKGMKLGMG